jgi:hypothetical protein
MAVAWLSLDLLQNNWTLHARLNMLLRGYVFCRLESPGRIEQLPLRPANEFVSKLAYKGHTYVGYLDPYGNFVPTSNTSIDRDAQASRNMVTTVVIFYSKWLLVLASAIFLSNLLWQIHRERRLAYGSSS